MKKKLLSSVMAAVLIFSSAAWGSAAEQENTYPKLSPRASVHISDGYIVGITEPVTADWLKAQFDCDVTVVDACGDELMGDSPVPSDGIVTGAGGETVKAVIPGDCNRDGKVNITDASEMLKKVAKWTIDVCIPAADVTDDGKVNLLDVSAVMKYAAGWDVILGERSVLEVSFEEYVLLANDPETDKIITDKVFARTGIEVQVVTEATEGDRFVTVGRSLWNEYSFMDKIRCRALFPENVYIDTYGGDVYISASGDAGIEACVEYLTSVETLFIPRGYTGTAGRLIGSSQKLYDDAVSRIKEAGLKGGTANEMTDDIYIALANAEYTEPKNIIMMIGDGMGSGAVNGAEILYGDRLRGGTLAMRHMPVHGKSMTYSDLDQYTDSAASGTALATGYKTSESTVAMNSDHSEDYKTLVEMAAEHGKSTGVVVTKNVTDATPAAFTSHVEDRYMWDEIAIDQLESLSDGTLDILLGGGSNIYERDSVASSLANAEAKGVTYAKNWDTVVEAELPVVGLFAKDAISTTSDAVPSLAQMTAFALDRLSSDENGFFLMVEGSKIDTYGHENRLKDALGETYEFDCAVSVALRFVALNPDTVVIVTADHETGGLCVKPSFTSENILDSAYYLMARHHWANVPVYAIGYGTGAIADTVENADIGRFAASLLGESVGTDSERYPLFDLTDKSVTDEIISMNPGVASMTDEGLAISFTPDARELVLPVSLMAPTGTVRAVNITYKNCCDSPVTVPSFRYTTADGETIVEEWWNYAMPGEYFTESYIIPQNFIGEGKFDDITALRLLGGKSRNYNYIITEITVVDRPQGK